MITSAMTTSTAAPSRNIALILPEHRRHCPPLSLAPSFLASCPPRWCRVNCLLPRVDYGRMEVMKHLSGRTSPATTAAAATAATAAAAVEDSTNSHTSNSQPRQKKEDSQMTKYSSSTTLPAADVTSLILMLLFLRAPILCF